MTTHEFGLQANYYPRRAEDDLLAVLHHADPNETAPIPEIMQGVDDVDFLYYGPHPMNDEGHFVYGYDKERDVVVRSLRTDVLPKDVNDLVTARVLQYGFTKQSGYGYKDQPDGLARIARGLGYTFVAFPAARGGIDDGGGVSCTFVAKGEDHSYEDLMTEARHRFPSVFERLESEAIGKKVDIRLADEPELIAEPSGLADTRNYDDFSSNKESFVRQGLARLMYDLDVSFTIARAEQPAADPSELADKVIAASQTQVALALHENELAADNKDALEAAAREFMLTTPAEGRAWLERKGLNYATINEAEREERIPAPIAIPSIAPAAPEAELFEPEIIQGPEGRPLRSGVLSKLGALTSGVLSAARSAYDAVGSRILGNNLAAHLPDVNNLKDRFVDEEGRLNRRGRVAVATGVAVVASVVVVASYFGLREILPSGSRHLAEGMPVPEPHMPSAVPDAPGFAHSPSEGLPGTPRPPITEIVPHLKEVKLAAGQTVWQHAVDVLPRGASEHDIYFKTVDIMKASGIPVDAAGPDPLAAARYLPENTSLFIPVN